MIRNFSINDHTNSSVILPNSIEYILLQKAFRYGTNIDYNPHKTVFFHAGIKHSILQSVFIIQKCFFQLYVFFLANLQSGFCFISCHRQHATCQGDQLKDIYIGYACVLRENLGVSTLRDNIEYMQFIYSFFCFFASKSKTHNKCNSFFFNFNLFSFGLLTQSWSRYGTIFGQYNCVGV